MLSLILIFNILIFKLTTPFYNITTRARFIHPLSDSQILLVALLVESLMKKNYSVADMDIDAIQEGIRRN